MPNAKRRILFLITTADWGGAQHFVFHLARDAQKNGMDVMLAAGGQGELQERAARTGIAFTHLRYLERQIPRLSDIPATWEIYRLIRNFRPDTVHVNSSKMSVVGAVAARMARVPLVIYRIGGWAFLERVSPLKRWIYLKAEQWTASLKDIIVTVHPGDEAAGREHAITPRKRLLTIPNGIQLDIFDHHLLSREAARHALGLQPDENVIGTIANFYTPKNIPGYLEAIAAMRDLPASVRFVIIGDGPDHDIVMKRYAELNLGQRVLFAGRRTDASALLRAFDLFVLPSSKEGMPWVLLEAMAARLPCIATKVGACQWMLEPDGGILIPPLDTSALTTAIRSLLADTTQQSCLGAHARAIIEKRFRWETALHDTLQLFI